MLPEDRKAKSADIFAAEKIIADISTGLYRTPAAALKELVSNAYDADAETVSISTDVPNFRNLVIEDDGSGMSVDRFLDVVRHIGGSKKRIEDGDVTPIKQRKIIGRIGIGLLAVAQLGYRFYVSSSKRGVPFSVYCGD
jgi:HSP90 family molecular chaperone